MALRDTFLLMLIPLAAGALILLVARRLLPGGCGGGRPGPTDEERGAPH